MSSSAPRKVVRRALRAFPPSRGALARYDEAVAERDHLQDEVRKLRREIQRLDASTDYEFLFVVTYARSGSTLLQGLLNSIPGYLIRGENRGATWELFQIHRQLLADRRKFGRRGPTDPRHPWFGIEGYRKRRAFVELRRLVVFTLLRPGPEDRVLGFKEIRWDYPELDDYLRFMGRVFPGARFIVNLRNHADVAKSKEWADLSHARGTLARIERKLLAAAEQLGDQAYVVRYDDWVADPDSLKGMYEWLGEDYSRETVEGVLATPHSY